MKIDKFGLGSLIIGALIVLGMLEFFFMENGWTMGGLVNALVITIQGTIILAGIFLFVIGILLLWL